MKVGLYMYMYLTPIYLNAWYMYMYMQPAILIHVHVEIAQIKISDRYEHGTCTILQHLLKWLKV